VVFQDELEALHGLGLCGVNLASSLVFRDGSGGQPSQFLVVCVTLPDILRKRRESNADARARMNSKSITRSSSRSLPFPAAGTQSKWATYCASEVFSASSGSHCHPASRLRVVEGIASFPALGVCWVHPGVDRMVAGSSGKNSGLSAWSRPDPRAVQWFADCPWRVTDPANVHCGPCRATLAQSQSQSDISHSCRPWCQAGFSSTEAWRRLKAACHS
jgi:hypothetical protein